MESSTATEATTWAIDVNHSTVEFAAKHMMITTVKGRLPSFSGSIITNESDPAKSSVAVEFDAASIDTRAEQRDEHLRSADFLDVANYPTIKFVSRGFEGIKLEPGAEFVMIGDLTIRDVTREVRLDVTFEGTGQDPWGGERISFSAKCKIDRRDFGLTWNAALETGGVLVSNDLKLEIAVQGVKQAQ